MPPGHAKRAEKGGGKGMKTHGMVIPGRLQEAGLQEKLRSIEGGVQYNHPYVHCLVTLQKPVWPSL
jgi:uncharacterized protein YndB with AHSA1/START domain